MKSEIVFEIGSVEFNPSKEKYELKGLNVTFGGEQTEGETKSIIESAKERMSLVKEFVCAAPEMAKAIKEAGDILNQPNPTLVAHLSSLEASVMHVNERMNKYESDQHSSNLKDLADEKS
ncbi:hypothetical protein JEZ13_04155 [bacterium]|nr:hypothetical protein [bacterium]MBI9072947.1 hypothetical protein [Melioribacteraceae bacterium]